ncbi:hypothetical protein R75461_05927 [Paraburkholderia nemoris]|nr:hypothetical protein R75461_05927 [Paraburkholderia nemoris]
MSPAFVKDVGEHLPDTRLTSEKFHVVAHASKALDTVRRQQQDGRDDELHAAGAMTLQLEGAIAHLAGTVETHGTSNGDGAGLVVDRQPAAHLRQCSDQDR